MEEQAPTNWWKIITGSALAAVLSAVLTYRYQMANLRQQERENEREFVKAFVEYALDKNLEKRFRLAHYFFHLRGGASWTAYFADLRMEKQTKEAKIDRYKELRKKRKLSDVEYDQFQQIQQDLTPVYIISTPDKRGKVLLPPKKGKKPMFSW